MKVVQTGFSGLVVLEPRILRDSRGFFLESYNRSTLLGLGIDVTFVQDNLSKSMRGTLRGLHFQKAPHAQSKLVSVLLGSILDVVVDLRSKEPTFGKHFAITLDDNNRQQLLIPKGFAHGFVVLSESAEVFYKCDEFYVPASEAGILYNDPQLGIDWKVPDEKLILSDRDKKHPLLSKVNPDF